VSEAEIVSKFAANVRTILSAEHAAGLRENVMQLDTSDDTGSPKSHLAGEPPEPPPGRGRR
jgi:hypothetical protein